MAGCLGRFPRLAHPCGVRLQRSLNGHSLATNLDLPRKSPPLCRIDGPGSTIHLSRSERADPEEADVVRGMPIAIAPTRSVNGCAMLNGVFALERGR